MAITIAVSGKGGTGKTTLTSMIIRSLLPHANGGGILAVDADPNSCLGITLGLEPACTISEIREGAKKNQLTGTGNSGMDRVRTFEYGINQALAEAEGFDLLTMGRPEGPSCYCASNNILRTFLDKLSSQYKFVVIDNEAGMEHLSRRTTNNVDLLCIIAEQTPIGIVTIKRISSLANQLPITIKEIGILWNQTREASAEKLQAIDKIDGLESFGSVPYDTSVFNASLQEQTVFDVDEDSPAFVAVKKMIEHKLNL